MVPEIVFPLVQYGGSKFIPAQQEIWEKKLRKHEYIEHIANYLVESATPTLTSVPRRTFNPSTDERLTQRHFPKRIPLRNGKLQGILCRACNFTRSQMVALGHAPQNLPRKSTIYWCEDCDTPLCITPCFEIYHTKADFRRMSLLRRLLTDFTQS